MRLRPLEAKDTEGMSEWMQDLDIQKSFLFSTQDKTYDDVLGFINAAETQPIDGKSIHYAIADDNDEYLGTISLKNVNLQCRSAEYAISLRKCAQGKGIATWATKKILQMAFEEFHFQRVYLNVLSDNERAIRLYEKCGFTYEGTFRRHLFLKGEFKRLKWYSILDNEYFWGVIIRFISFPAVSVFYAVEGGLFR